MIEILKGRNRVKVNGEEHPVEWGGSFTPEGYRYTIESFKFTDEFGKKADGCLFTLPAAAPGEYGPTTCVSTRVMEITDPSLNVERNIDEGQGWYLGLDRDGIILHEIGVDIPSDLGHATIPLSVGMIDCFIAGVKGMRVADISSPPFESTMEEEVSRDDPRIPAAFWGIYDHLKAGGRVEFVEVGTIQIGREKIKLLAEENRLKPRNE